MSYSPIEVAKAYVAASNAHDLTTIEPMLSVDCEYQSSGVGHHAGDIGYVEMDIRMRQAGGGRLDA